MPNPNLSQVFLDSDHCSVHLAIVFATRDLFSATVDHVQARRDKHTKPVFISDGHNFTFYQYECFESNRVVDFVCLGVPSTRDVPHASAASAIYLHKYTPHYALLATNGITAPGADSESSLVYVDSAMYYDQGRVRRKKGSDGGVRFKASAQFVRASMPAPPSGATAHGSAVSTARDYSRYIDAFDDEGDGDFEDWIDNNKVIVVDALSAPFFTACSAVPLEQGAKCFGALLVLDVTGEVTKTRAEDLARVIVDDYISGVESGHWPYPKRRPPDLDGEHLALQYFDNYIRKVLDIIQLHRTLGIQQDREVRRDYTLFLVQFPEENLETLNHDNLGRHLSTYDLTKDHGSLDGLREFTWYISNGGADPRLPVYRAYDVPTNLNRLTDAPAEVRRVHYMKFWARIHREAERRGLSAHVKVISTDDLRRFTAFRGRTESLESIHDAGEVESPIIDTGRPRSRGPTYDNTGDVSEDPDADDDSSFASRTSAMSWVPSWRQARVSICYSWHEGTNKDECSEFCRRVAELKDGFVAHGFEHVSFDRTHEARVDMVARTSHDWMSSHVTDAHVVIVVGSPSYRAGIKKAREGPDAQGRGIEWEFAHIEKRLQQPYQRQRTLFITLDRSHKREMSFPDSIHKINGVSFLDVHSSDAEDTLFQAIEKLFPASSTGGAYDVHGSL